MVKKLDSIYKQKRFTSDPINIKRKLMTQCSHILLKKRLCHGKLRILVTMLAMLIMKILESVTREIPKCTSSIASMEENKQTIEHITARLLDEARNLNSNKEPTASFFSAVSSDKKK